MFNKILTRKSKRREAERLANAKCEGIPLEDKVPVDAIPKLQGEKSAPQPGQKEKQDKEDSFE